MERSFPERYGPWALVAGASEGLGAAFAQALAARGLHLLLLARRGALLEQLAAQLREQHGVQVRTCALDVAAADFAELGAGLEIGVAVYNAAFAPIGDFLSQPLDELLRVVDVNVRGPLAMVRSLAPAMVERRRGAVLLMSSLAGGQGAPRIATYAASKAFNTILAEGLWQELGQHGVDVLACCAGAIRTPGYTESAAREAPGTLDASAVAERCLRALGHGPRVVPGLVNGLAGFVMTRLLPRTRAIAIMAGSTRELS